ncbi:MAG: hypothetical protein ISS35_03790 [Kiritimatiellae bacterium]|nr:hypothetical protein [Kiritimatiellia bacterium]
MEPVLFSDWDAWRERCALDLCEDQTRTRLTSFAHSRMRYFVRHHMSVTNIHWDDANLCVPAASECWHHFETHAMLSESRQGKRYKEWLFARLEQNTTDQPLDIVQGGATLIMRDVVRQYLQVEFAPRGTVSMDRPIGPGPHAPTLADLLPGEPDPTDMVSAREYEQLAGEHAQEFFQNMSTRERIALLAKFEGISLAHPRIEKAAKCRKSVLSTAARNAVTRLALQLQRKYRDDGADAIMTLSILVLQKLEKCLKSWKNSEKRLLTLFNRA